MRKPSPQFISRVQLRAYYLHLAHPERDALTNWLEAEAHERKLVERKTASAKASKARRAAIAAVDEMIARGATLVHLPEITEEQLAFQRSFGDNRTGWSGLT